MKKRFLSILLSVALLFTLIPAGIISASAASFSPSESCIELLKGFEGFCAKPYGDSGQYFIGYGTTCPPENLDRYMAEGISEAEAEELLHTYLNGMCGAINSFIDRNGLSLNQNQFDALVLFTYNCSSEWMNDSEGMFHDAVVNGKTGNDFIFPIVRWCVAGDSILEGLVRRRLVEANLYLNGVYSASAPANYSYVCYDANGGSTPYRIQGYDSDLTAAVIPTPTRSGYQFDGWYTARTGGTKVTVLDATVRNCTLYAHWVGSSGEQAGSASNPAENVGTAITPVEVTVTNENVNLRQGPGTTYGTVGQANKGDKYTITATATGSGYEWGKFDGGWLALTYTNYDSVVNGSNNSSTTTSEMGTITGDELRIRSGPSTAYSVQGYLNSGDRVEILEQKTAGSMVWGKISSGWISMDYVKLDSDNSGSNTSTGTTNSGTTATSESGKVVYTDSLRIRSGPSTDYSIVGYLSGGTAVTITERTTTGSMEWGKISSGWISLDYVEFGSADSSNAVGGTVIVDDALRIRSGPSTSYSIAGYLDSGEHVQITERKTVDGMEWGKISSGWISMDYIRLDGESSSASSGSQTVIADCLNVRSDAGMGNSVVAYLYYGQKVTVTDTKTADGMEWGKISSGWICMDYVQ